MRRIVVPFLLCLSLLGVYAQPVLQLPHELPPHPRLLLSRGAEAQLASRIQSDAFLTRVHEGLLKEATAMLKLPLLERKLKGRRLLDVSREALRRIFYLSYAYRMSADKRFAERAEREMLNVSAFKDWNPSHFLDVAEMTTALAIGYDWLFDYLSASSRRKISAAILDKGIRLTTNGQKLSWRSAVHNWNQVCNTGMTFGALAVYEVDRDACARAIQESAHSIELPMGEYEPDGAYPEGYSYWEYGTTYNVLFLSALSSALGTELGLPERHSGFMKTGSFILHMTGPTGLPFNFSDASSKGMFMSALFWFASRSGDASVLLSQKPWLEGGSLSLRDRFLPALLLWSAGWKSAAIPAPASRVWSAGGHTPLVLMRSAWSADATYLAVKGGSPATNHAHMDAGSFVLDMGGERWAIDFGKQDYESLESRGVDLWNKRQDSQRWQVFRLGNLAHNTLTFNGMAHSATGFAPIVRTIDNDEFMGAILDLSPTFSGQVAAARRGVAIAGEQVVIIRDEIATLPGDAALVRWNMATGAEVESIQGNELVLLKNGKRLRMRILEPSGALFRTWESIGGHDYDAANPGTILVGFEYPLPPGMETAMTVVLMPLDREASDPKIVPLDEWR